jgi:hypothetical protein
VGASTDDVSTLSSLAWGGMVRGLLCQCIFS